MIAFGNPCDKVVVESELDSVVVRSVYVAEEESLALISGVIEERHFDGVEMIRRGDAWLLIGFYGGTEEVICEIITEDDVISFERIGFTEGPSAWNYRV